MTTQVVTVGKRQVELSNLDKDLYPAAHFTKAEVVEYYRAIAPVLLPHLKNRPIVMKRYPDGVEGEAFYERRCPAHRPEWVKTEELPSSVKPVNACLINDLPTLIWVANLAALELHGLLALSRDLARPTHLVFDLDPGPPATLLDCIPVAFRIRDRFADSGLETFVKVSGSKGLHLLIPLNTKCTHDETKAVAHALAITLAAETPETVVAKMAKVLRGGKIFIDWSQNDDHKTTVMPYSLRAQPTPTVSTPVSWEELAAARKRKSAKSLSFTPSQALKRVEKLGDLLAPLLTLKQKLPKVDAFGSGVTANVM